MPAKKRFLLCVRNKGYEVSLERRKLYQVVPDADAGQHGQVRVIDEAAPGAVPALEAFLPLPLHFVVVSLDERSCFSPTLRSA